jgi:outer membrane protein TolC
MVRRGGEIPNIVPANPTASSGRFNRIPSQLPRIPAPFDAPLNAARETFRDFYPSSSSSPFTNPFSLPTASNFSGEQTYQRQRTRFAQAPPIAPTPGDNKRWNLEEALPSNPLDTNSGSVTPNLQYLPGTGRRTPDLSAGQPRAVLPAPMPGQHSLPQATTPQQTTPPGLITPVEPSLNESQDSIGLHQARSAEFILSQLKYPVEHHNLKTGPPVPGIVDDREPWTLSLYDAHRIALERSPLVQVMDIDIQLAESNLEAKRGTFQPILSASAGWGYDDQQLTSTVGTAGTGSTTQTSRFFGTSAGASELFGISKALRSGGRLGVNYSVDKTRQDPVGTFGTLNPYWRSTGRIEWTQPLFKGRGFRVTKIPLILAEYTVEEEKFATQQKIQGVLRDVEQKYWLLVMAHRTLAFSLQDLSQAEALLDREKRKLEVGKASLFEVNYVHDYYTHKRLGVLLDQDRILTAEFDLRQILGLPILDNKRLTVKKDLAIPQVHMDWERDLGLAMHKRTEIQSQIYNIKEAELNLEVARNNMKPDVQMGANYGLSGLGADFNDSWDRVFSGSTPSWNIYLTYQRQLGMPVEKSELRNAWLEVTRQQRKLAIQQHTVRAGLASAYQKVYIAYQRYALSREVADAGLHTYLAYQEFYGTGQVGVDLLVRARTRWAESREEEQRAIIWIYTALAEWEQSRGTVFDQYAFFADQHPTQSLPRQGNQDPDALLRREAPQYIKDN